jgi:ketosteroid isomerase-like protein
MKSLFLLIIAVLALGWSTTWATGFQGGPSQIPAAQRKAKVKNGQSIERDKSKPVRKALEDWYANNIAAFKARDVAAIMSLRTDHFHTFTPDGKVNTRADMEAYTRRFLGRIDHFLSLEFQIGVIDVQGDLAGADVTQKTLRMQRLPDGSLHKVEASVVQRETWKRTTQGWKMYTVDNIRDSVVLVDGQPYKPAS